MHPTNDPKDYPQVSYRVTGQAESNTPGKKRVVIEIAVERVLNGFYGETVSLEVHEDLGEPQLDAEVRRMVKWTVQHRTGHTIPNVNFHFYKAPTNSDAPPVPEPPVPVSDSPPVAEDLTPPVGEPADGVPAPVEGADVPNPVA